MGRGYNKLRDLSLRLNLIVRFIIIVVNQELLLKQLLQVITMMYVMKELTILYLNGVNGIWKQQDRKSNQVNAWNRVYVIRDGKKIKN